MRTQGGASLCLGLICLALNRAEDPSSPESSAISSLYQTEKRPTCSYAAEFRGVHQASLAPHRTRVARQVTRGQTSSA